MSFGTSQVLNLKYAGSGQRKLHLSGNYPEINYRKEGLLLWARVSRTDGQLVNLVRLRVLLNVFVRQDAS